MTGNKVRPWTAFEAPDCIYLFSLVIGVSCHESSWFRRSGSFSAARLKSSFLHLLCLKMDEITRIIQKCQAKLGVFLFVFFLWKFSFFFIIYKKMYLVTIFLFSPCDCNSHLLYFHPLPSVLQWNTVVILYFIHWPVNRKVTSEKHLVHRTWTTKTKCVTPETLHDCGLVV